MAKVSAGFTADEKEAIKNRARELAAEAKAERTRAEGENDVQAAIAALQEPDRSMAQRVDAIVKAAVPELASKTWYGMPAYTLNGKIVCFFQSSQKFGSRYSTLGFSDAAHLDNGGMWPVAYALTQITAVEEALITQLVKQAVAK